MKSFRTIGLPRMSFACFMVLMMAGSCISLAQDKKIDRKLLRKKNVNHDTYITFTADRQVLVVPMTWKEIFLRYDRIPEKGEYQAYRLFDFARLYDLDTLHSLTDSTIFVFGSPGFADFFRQFKPLSIERIFNSSPFDTLRLNNEGLMKHFPDMSKHWRMYFADTSRGPAIEALSRIPGVSEPHRPEMGIELEDMSSDHIPSSSVPDGMTTTPSGLKYRIVNDGIGEPAVQGQSVRIHETTTLSDGTLIFSTRTQNKPLKFDLGANQVITGVDEGVTGMKVGERRLLVVPPALSKRSAYPASIHPDSTLYYDIELVQILTK